ncbi:MULTISPECIES: hypothetical protein [Aeromonas]|jgi:hypothetical protein|nr:MULTISPECIES: hypothetical protein [Aeromonas]MCE9927143.1 hypothetical protein [Aeromonas media]MCE9945064.1 hypothetical protein [Aeromonas rivipollensis]MCE9954722.1 hypothetical protein [Aeromonas rivipollensis]MDM5084386.1 hypothetical protein [Aeromonas rivipollensis]MDM5092686.1 hypothetical protein [Aeromonas rivipollensis]
MKTYIALAIISLSAFAQQSQAENRVDLGSQALSNIRGAMGVNMVAGNNNQQGNLAAIALSGPAIVQFSQQNQSTTNLNGNQSVAILGSALSQSQGLVGINQGAGEANQQLNAFALSLDDSGIGVVTDINLSTSVAKTPSGKVPPNTTTSIYLDDNALTGSKGVIQVNQVTGQGNQAVNMVSLPLAGAVTTSP